MNEQPRLSHYEAIDMIDEMMSIEHSYAKLKEREKQFCESIYDSNYPELTEKQTKWLNDIFDRVMK